MEAVPRLPMLSCELKTSASNAEFGPALKKYIAEFYHENSESYVKEIKEIEGLRQSAIKVPRDFTGCRVLKRYFSQLQCLQNRFPMSENGPASVAFMWNDLYSGFEYGIMDIQYEQACILYNIGALHSELGAADCRTNAEGMKVACTHFQCAAWAFQHLRDSPTYPTPRGSDTSRDLLTCFVTLMLAQAQECILEKSMLDSRKSTITAKVATQVVDYYHSALNVLQEGSANVEAGCILDTVGSKIYKHWKKFMEFKMAYYGSISQLYMGNQAEEQQQMGDRVAWYTAALNKHSEAVKIAKDLDREDLSEALTFTLDVMAGKCNAAKKENDFVYHEKVPSPESLPEIKGGSLVKGIPFDPTDPDICGPDIFARLVPMEAHEAASVYSEEKAKILRNTSAKIDEKEQELITYLSSLQLDRDALLPKEEILPQDIVEKCAALSVRPNAINDVKESLQALTDVFNEVDMSVKDVRRILLLEEEREKGHQEVFGKRPPSLIVTELSKECGKYEEAYRRASDSNATLQKALELHLANLKLLASPLDQLQKALPTISINNSPEKMSLVGELQMLLDKVEEMRRQRHQLDNQLREAIQADDITKLLVARDKNQDMQKLFHDQLKKHDQIITFLDQNLSAQDNILRALTSANARFATTRKNIQEAKHRREMLVASLLSSYDAYEDLISKAQKGMDFYRKLQTNVMRLHARTKSVTSVQEEERQQITQAQARKAAKIIGYNNSTNPLPPSSSSGPKLKDFLPYMTSSRSKGSVPEALPSQVTAWCTSGVSSNPDINLQEIRSNMETNLPEDNKLRTGYSQQTSDQAPMGIRPAPVGSEQVPPATCPSFARPSMSISNYSSTDMKPQNWNYLQGNIAFQQDPKSYNPAGASYGYSTNPSDSGQYYQTSQYSASVVPSQGYEYSGNVAHLPSTTLSSYNYEGSQVSPAQSITSQQGVYSNVIASTATSHATTAAGVVPYNTSSVSTSNSYSPYSATQYGYTPEVGVGSGSTLPSSTSQGFVHSAISTNHTSVSNGSLVSNLQYYNQPSSYGMYPDPTPAQYSETPAVSQQPGYSQYPAAVGSLQDPSVYSQNASSTYSTNISQQHPYQYSTSLTSTSLTTAQSSAYSQYSRNSSITSTTVSQTSGYSQYPTSSETSSIHQTSDTRPSSTVTTASGTYPISSTGYSYTNADNINNQYPGSESSASGSTQNYPYSQLPGVTLPTSLSLTYGTGTQSQYTPGPEVPQTNMVYSYGNYNNPNVYHSSQEPSQVVPQHSNYYSAASQTATGYGIPSSDLYTSTVQNYQNVSTPPSAYSASILTPTPITPVLGAGESSDTANMLTSSNINELKTPQSQPSSTSSSPAKASSVCSENKDILDSLVADVSQEGLRPVLQPKVLSMSELSVSSKEVEGNVNQRQTKDPFLDSSVLDRFVSEVERFKKVVEGLTKKSLNGQTPLDQKWKEVMDAQDKDTKKMSISVARCYPMKNRFPEIMPYDSNRVELHAAKNDYINASFVSDLMPMCPKYIVTQAPLPTTFSDFWTMVWEQQAEIVVCLLVNAELKGHVYWPTERGQVLNFDLVNVKLHSIKETPSHVESMLNIIHVESKLSRVVIHLQFTAWPPGEVPSNPSTFLQFIGDVHNYHWQQRNLQRPIVVHCSGGVGRSGAFCLLSATLKELGQGHSPADCSLLASLACQQRKALLQEREQLKFCYEATLYHAQDILVKRGILSNKSTFDDILPSAGGRRTHSRHPSEDFILAGSINTKPQSNNENENDTAESVPAPGEETTPNIPTKSESFTPTPEPTEVPDMVKITPADSPAIPADVNYEQKSSQPPCITSILDPANFTLGEPMSSPGKQRFTKDSFKNPSGLVQPSKNSADPLSQLDPLWSLKKSAGD